MLALLAAVDNGELRMSQANGGCDRNELCFRYALLVAHIAEHDAEAASRFGSSLQNRTLIFSPEYCTTLSA